MLRDPGVLYIFTSKCASRHNGVHFFDIRTSKSAPRPSVFNTFDFEMCFAPQRRALFRHLNFQKCSETHVFCTFSLRNELRATTPCTFSSSQLRKPLRDPQFLTHFTSKCASRDNGVHFFDISTSKSAPRPKCFVHFHFEIGFAPQRSATFHLSFFQMSPHPRFSEPTFRPSGATKPRKNTVFRDFPTFSRTCIFFLLIFSLLALLPADCFFISPYCGKFDF